MRIRQLTRPIFEMASTPFEVLYHGTDPDNLDSIMSIGVDPPSNWTPDIEVARYFGDLILQAPVQAFNRQQLFPDENMAVDVIDPVAEYWGIEDMSPDEWDNWLETKWSMSGRTWEDSLHILRAVEYNGVIPPNVLQEVR